MVAKLHSWWQQIKQHRVAIVAIAIILAVAIVLIKVGYRFDWTGFNGYNKVTITHTISGTNAGTVTRTEEYQPGKGLWDWLQLLGVLAIPVVVGIGAAWYTAQQGKVTDAENKDNQRETLLQDYLNKMAELLINANLRESAGDDEVRKIARVRTLTVLPRLDAIRKRSVLQFLYEAGLIYKGSVIVDLQDADLRDSSLQKAHLSLANLQGANLSFADLRDAHLGGANLRRANLQGANLHFAGLQGADLQDVEMQGANLHVANLKSADLQGAGLQRAYLHVANLQGANLYLTQLQGANLQLAGLQGANLQFANLEGADLKGVDGISREEIEQQTDFLEGATMPDGSKHP